MDAVLGLSMTPSSIGLVLVEGCDADGPTMERGAYEIRTSDEAAAAVLRSEALAAERGLRLKAIGLTWSMDADAEASILMRSLSESGFDNVVPVRTPEATEALARGIAEVTGYETTAVCAIEADVVIALIVHPDSGSMQTAYNHAIESNEGLISWLSTMFARAARQPDALIVVGSAGDFDDILPDLQDALSVPVFSPAEAELALARGAALVSAASREQPRSYIFGDVPRLDDWDDIAGELGDPQQPVVTGTHRPDEVRRRQWTPALPLTMLALGSVTFVASASIAITLQFLPGDHGGPVSTAPPSHPPAAASVVAPSAAPAPVTPAAEPSAVRAVPPTEAPAQAHDSIESAPDVTQAPDAVSEPAPAAVPDQIATVVAPAPANDTPTVVQTIQAAPPVVNSAPADVSDHRTLRSRIMDRLRGMGQLVP